MADPTTPNTGLAVPSHGSDVDTWDQPLNANATAIDGYLGGVTQISLTNVPVTLTAPAGVITPGPGPTQSQNAVLKLTGVLASNVLVTLPLPGYYIIDNETTGGFFPRLQAAGLGAIVGLPPGAQAHVFSDGTDVKFVDLGAPSKLEFFSGYSAMPPWMAACTVKPYLVLDGAIYNVADYPTLGAIYGSKFGGNGSTTFGVIDARGRVILPYDGTGARITVAGCGVDGQSLGSAGGSQLLQGHTHVFGGTTTTENQAHTHSALSPGSTGSTTGGGAFPLYNAGSPAFFTQTGPENVPHVHDYSGVTGVTGAGSSSNLPPAVVGGIWMVKT